jgi:hypothetical protein
LADTAVVEAELVFVDDPIVTAEIVAAEIVAADTRAEDGRQGDRSPVLYIR